MSLVRSVWNFISSPIGKAVPARTSPVDAIVRLLKEAPRELSEIPKRRSRHRIP